MTIDSQTGSCDRWLKLLEHQSVEPPPTIGAPDLWARAQIATLLVRRKAAARKSVRVAVVLRASVALAAVAVVGATLAVLPASVWFTASLPTWVIPVLMAVGALPILAPTT